MNNKRPWKRKWNKKKHMLVFSKIKIKEYILKEHALNVNSEQPILKYIPGKLLNLRVTF